MDLMTLDVVERSQNSQSPMNRGFSRVWSLFCHKVKLVWRCERTCMPMTASKYWIFRGNLA